MKRNIDWSTKRVLTDQQGWRWHGVVESWRGRHPQHHLLRWQLSSDPPLWNICLWFALLWFKLTLCWKLIVLFWRTKQCNDLYRCWLRHCLYHQREMLRFDYQKKKIKRPTQKAIPVNWIRIRATPTISALSKMKYWKSKMEKENTPK